ncbi:MAG: DUF4881 domain-containing protein [Desulfobacterales bacterium]|nr:DUF4881 domain-containing protein [Pseudomonadota bacterium]MBU4354491.1 DUF4881 domain-containing protein [Pseudomonadota bacterium]MCG2773062.1 DUF4881 domain-containing protein [Desulfobacterales bacterium]
MGKKLKWWALVASLAATLVLGGLGCGELGKVDQGRVIAFDKDKETVTFINDVKHDAANPDYSGAPVTFALPKDPAERGEDPKAGLRMKLDTKTREIIIYDLPTKSMKHITYTLIDQKENVAKTSPLVEGKKFPMVDKDKKAITVYSGRQKLLVTFSVPEEYFALPDYTWEAGDEVRIYYKEPGKIARFMNITKTDIFKK